VRTPAVEVETTIAASPRQVWNTIVAHPSVLFMGAKVETDWQVGHPITMSGDHNGKPFRDQGEIRAFDEAHRLSFTHKSGGAGSTNLVTFDLAPEGDATRMKLSQTPLGDTQVSDDQKKMFAKSWASMLDSLKKEAERKG